MTILGEKIAYFYILNEEQIQLYEVKPLNKF